MSDSQNHEGAAELKQGDSNDCRTNNSPPSECLDLVPTITQQREYVLSPPGPIEITSVTHDTVSLSWEPSQGLTESMRFRVTWKCESTGDLLCSEVSVANICIQGLTPGVKYEFTVVTINDSGGQSTKVVSTAQTTDVLVPKELTVNEVTTSSAHLSWTLPHEVDLTPHSFRISYSSTGKDEEFISTSSYSTVITGLQPDTDYTVNVSVVCHSGICQPASITIHTNLPTPGQIKIKSVAHDAVSLSWEPPEGLTESLRFRVTWKCESTGKLLCSEVPVPNICIQGLSPEVKYEFTVATINDSRGQSTKVVSTAQTTEVPVPKKLTVDEVTPTSALLFWALPYNMDLTPHKFLISYSSAGKGQTCISTPWYSTVITGLQPETDYTVSVSVVCYSGTFQPATTDFHTNGVARPSKDQQLSTTSAPQDSWEILTSTDGDERPSKDKQPSTTSTSEGVSAPENLTVDSVTATSANLSWSLSCGTYQTPHSFLISYHSEGTAPQTISTNSCSAVITGLKPETGYTVSVSTENQLREKSQPASVSILTGVPAPENLTVDSVTATSGNLNWSLSCGTYQTPHSFLISYHSEGTEPQTISTNSCSAVITGLKPETGYTVSVSTENQLREKSQPASVSILTGVPAPENLTVDSVTAKSANLSWSLSCGTYQTPHSFLISYHSEGTEPQTISTDACSAVITGLKPHTEYTVSVSTENQHREKSQPASVSILTGPSGKTYYTLAPGKSAEYSKDIETWLKPLTKAKSAQSCDIILALCLVVSRVGTDVEAALKAIPDSKPTILVVLHHTFDPDHVVPDSSRFTKREDMLIVDCLFNEDDGLLRCERNGISQSTMLKWVDTKVSIKEKPWRAVSSFFNWP
ncbi:fibronectin-like isoform X2 [Clupea harengus]|uniref:Fibronectin-like isoform X2 n=1 Tax=Clupea harengus TaxID=7950 RepID=A0A6P8GP48_CLUHA|nr:fibronectin-like isoform X2 [Clupea harengus]